MDVDEESSDSNAEDSAYSGDDGIVIEENFSNGSQPRERSSGYQVLEPEEVAREMNLIIEDVAGIVHLPPTICRLLLHHYNWSKENLLEKSRREKDKVSKVCSFADESGNITKLAHLCLSPARYPLNMGVAVDSASWKGVNIYVAVVLREYGFRLTVLLVKFVLRCKARRAHSCELLRFYESSNLDAFFAKANIIPPLNKENVADGGKESVGPCVICCNQAHLTSLSCGHSFCYRCWDMYLTTKVVDEGSVYVACPQVGCSIVVDDEKASALIQKESVRKRYRRLTIKSFVEIMVADVRHVILFCPPSTLDSGHSLLCTCNRLLRWCPGADCGRVVKVAHSEARPVKCKCGTEFCFACVREWHEPVNCRLLQLWLKKCRDDSETSNWISANTKECPRCRATIEKDGGCNHVTCKNAACKMEFCWVCLGPWEPHGNSWYSCNRFDDSLAKKARDVQEKSRAALQRYLHYYNRFMNHQHSLKLENKLYATVKKKMEVMQQTNMSWVEVQFLQKAVDILSQCRRTLMYTYAFAFYLQKDNQSMIFEDNQRDLEHATEQLSEFLERDLENENLVSLKQKVSLHTTRYVNVAREKYFLKVQDKSRYVEQRRDALLKHCAEGVEHDFWKFSE
uniref:RBR-type E3 ubiquitin transferase n=1 Tax=Ascaris lumbricoides TaxID=6252 RepID=A0A0M3I1K6_ASCLU